MRWIGALLVAAFWALALAGHATAGETVTTENVEASLISEVRAIKPGSTFTVALRQKIREGWHTYWSNPGDSGEPTTIDWTLPQGFKAGPIQWPHPVRLPFGPLVNFGYSNEVLLLVDIKAPADLLPGTQVTLRADAGWLVCEEICIPEEGALDITLPVTDGTSLKDSRWAAAFATTRAAMPRPTSWVASYGIINGQLGIFVVAPEVGRATMEEAAFFPHKGGVIRNAAEQRVEPRADGILLWTEPGSSLKAGGPLSGSRFGGVLVLRARGSQSAEAFEVTAAEGPIPVRALSSDALGTDGGETARIGLAFALLYAFLGGLILNVMPCVLPVLSIKALAFVSKSGKEMGAARIEALIYTAGVILSFVAIAATLILLREVGAEIGWGFQLQSPLVVALLASLFLLIGLNFQGVFEIGGSFQNTGQGLAAQSGSLGAFFTGVLAVVVATPCTVPFMGAAIGYAVTQSSLDALLIFAMLGFGMALPFFLVSIFPSVISSLPRPGLWMVRLKEFLAFPMYMTAAWLVWVMTLQLGSEDALFPIFVVAIALAFAAWSFGVSQRDGGPLGVIGAGLGLIIAGVFLTFISPLPVPSNGRATAEQAGSGPISQHFTPERLASLRAEGRPVFVNLTAAWCITCQVNEQVALSSASMREEFERRNIAYLKGDWTNRDPVISRVLEAYGRAGVPLYLYFAPNADHAEILPQLLTEGILLSSIESADTAEARGPQ
ncbi:MAG: thioredoxin family protein [Alphaproteobacteria bacterium]|nr:thioredoxin family protein [Alphaproteobacteria bacterium]